MRERIEDWEVSIVEEGDEDWGGRGEDWGGRSEDWGGKGEDLGGRSEDWGRWMGFEG